MKDRLRGIADWLIYIGIAIYVMFCRKELEKSILDLVLGLEKEERTYIRDMLTYYEKHDGFLEKHSYNQSYNQLAKDAKAKVSNWPTLKKK